METIANLRGNAAPVAAAPEAPPAPTPPTPPTRPPSGGAGFSVGADVKVIQSAPDNKPPSAEDTIEGRYAGVLFTTASQQEALFTIYEDMVYLGEIFDSSEDFRLFTQNGGVGSIEIRKFNAGLQDMADFHPLTIKFLEILAENKRLVYLEAIIKRYTKLY